MLVQKVLLDSTEVVGSESLHLGLELYREGELVHNIYHQAFASRDILLLWEPQIYADSARVHTAYVDLPGHKIVFEGTVGDNERMVSEEIPLSTPERSSIVWLEVKLPTPFILAPIVPLTVIGVVSIFTIFTIAIVKSRAGR